MAGRRKPSPLFSSYGEAPAHKMSGLAQASPAGPRLGSATQPSPPFVLANFERADGAGQPGQDLELAPELEPDADARLDDGTALGAGQRACNLNDGGQVARFHGLDQWVEACQGRFVGPSARHSFILTGSGIQFSRLFALAKACESLLNKVKQGCLADRRLAGDLRDLFVPAGAEAAPELEKEVGRGRPGAAGN